VPNLQQWNTGNITLIGDAAHGTLPYLAQGAAMSLEDAAALSSILNSNDVTEAAFEKLGKQRIGRTCKLHHQTLRTGRIYHISKPVAIMRDAILRVLSPNSQFSNMDWIWTH
jgi:salicylate hydroxylase